MPPWITSVLRLLCDGLPPQCVQNTTAFLQYLVLSVPATATSSRSVLRDRCCSASSHSPRVLFPWLLTLLWCSKYQFWRLSWMSERESTLQLPFGFCCSSSFFLLKKTQCSLVKKKKVSQSIFKWTVGTAILKRF